jgi:two-component system OmpR family sensor kinase
VTLRARILAGVALILVVLVLAMVVITRSTATNLMDQVDAQLASAINPVRGYEFGLPGVQRGGPGRSRLSSVYLGQVIGDRVRTVAVPDLRSDEQPLPELTAQEAVDAARTGQAFTVSSSDSDVRYRLRAYVDDRFGVVVIGSPVDHVDQAVRRLIAVEAVVGSVVAAALGVMAWWVIHLGVRPIKRMTAAAATIGEGDLAHRVPEVDPRTEAGELGSALNRMLAQIESAFDERTRAENRLRQFVADASHELRTPLATIRGYAELYRAGALEQRDQLSDAMRRTEQEAIRMGRLVDDLLLLARLDQGRPLDAAPVDLAGVAADAASDARAIDPSRRVDARTEGPAVVAGDEFRLRQVVANLVGNALVHTEPGTPIEITTARCDGRVVLCVTDHGPGMAPETAARAFERFYRADPSRSRHRGGSGLGLAIVDATVRAHGGTVSLETAAGRGTTVRVELPALGR